MAIIHGLWTEPDGWSFDGEHWQVRESKRHGEIGRGGRRHPHIIFGGKGGPRLARLVARYGDEFNLSPGSPEAAPEAYANIRSACADIGRDPDGIVLSAMTGCLIAETESDLKARVADVARGARPVGTRWRGVACRSPQPLDHGDPGRGIRARAALSRQHGTQRIMLQDFVPRDLDHVRLMGKIFTA